MHSTRTDSSSDTGTPFSPLATPRAAPLESDDVVVNRSGGILSSMAALLGLQLEDTFFCQICMDDVALSQSHQLSACGHRFCASCLQSYMAFHIQEGETDLKCFFQEPRQQHDSATDKACLASIPHDETKRLVDEATFAKLQRFQFNKQHTNARQCPYCNHNQLCDSSRSTDCTCEACGRVFCFLHSNAHPGQPCSAYTKRTHKSEKQNLTAINRLCKACPGCGQFVEKDGGCSQVTCLACKTSFCWSCRMVIDKSTFSTHYQWWNIIGCGGRQTARVDELALGERGIRRFFQGLLLIILGPPAFILAAAVSFVGCCCYPCTKVYQVSYRQAFMSCVCVCGYLVLLPLLIPGAFLFLPCLLVAFCASPQSFRLTAAPKQLESSGDAVASNDSPV